MSELGALETRLGAVEQGITGLTVEVKETRQDVRDFVTAQSVGPRRETCPHNEDFVRLMSMLEQGGKRFSHIEEALEAAAIERNKHLQDHEQRIIALEATWTKAIASLQTAKWFIGGVALALGWILRDLFPFIERLLGGLR